MENWWHSNPKVAQIDTEGANRAGSCQPPEDFADHDRASRRSYVGNSYRDVRQPKSATRVERTGLGDFSEEIASGNPPGPFLCALVGSA